MAYPHTPYHDIVLYDPAASSGQEGSISLLELARSILLSQDDPTVDMPLKTIAEQVAAKNPFLAVGKKERWERSLRATLRDHYCFIGHSEDRRLKISYSCDPTIESKLRRTSKPNERVGSDSPFPEHASGGPVASTSAQSQLPSRQAKLAATPEQLIEGENSLEAITDLVLECSEVYETQRRDNPVQLYYCQECGPYLVLRQRWNGDIVTDSFRRLVQLVHGTDAEGQHLKPLFGLRQEDNWPESISRRQAQEVAERARLPLPNNSILADTYPDLPNDAPPHAPRYVKRIPCRYCGKTFTGRAYHAHLSETRGTCQLVEPVLLRQYLSLLNESLNQDLNTESASEDGSDDDEEEKGTIWYARPVIEPAFSAWTEDEVDRFFYALKRFSRYRTDAIAEHVQSKNEVEVVSLLNKLQENVDLLSCIPDTPKLNPAPAAREVSKAWLEMEEKLAEDAIVWEAFTQQATRTPLAYRDIAQRHATRHQHLSCLQCLVQDCDGQWPTCTPCRRRSLACHWPVDLGAGKDTEQESNILAALTRAQLHHQNQSSQQEAIRRAIRDEFTQSLSWYQLLSLSTLSSPGSLKGRLELLWWKACSAGNVSQTRARASRSSTRSETNENKPFSRRLIAQGILDAKLDNVGLEEMEALYQYIKQQRHEEGFNMPTAGELAALRSLPGLLTIRAQLQEALAQEEETPSVNRAQKMWLRPALKWTDIPISGVSAARRSQYPYFEGIQEEVQQAQQQLRALQFSPQDLGYEAELFNLRNLGMLLDLYRQGTDDVAHISKQVLQDLYLIVRKNVAQVLALALSIADSKDIAYSPGKPSKSDLFTECITEASATIKLQAEGSGRCWSPDIFRQASGKSAVKNARTSDTNVQVGEVRMPAPALSNDQSSRRQEFALLPLDIYGLKPWDADIVSSDDDEDDGESSSISSGSDLGTALDIENAEKLEVHKQARQLEKKLDEKDKFDDAIYEQSLWDLIKGGANMREGVDLHQIDEDGLTQEEGDEESDLDRSETEQDAEDELEMSDFQEDGYLDLDDISDDAAADDDTSVAKTGSKRRSSPDTERSRKRQRKVSPRSESPALLSLNTDTGTEKRKGKGKVEYRTQEFITTSDEEEQD